MMAVLGGADLVVFTGGIGENDGKMLGASDTVNPCSCGMHITYSFSRERAKTRRSMGQISIRSLENDQRALRDLSCEQPHDWSVDAG